MRGISVADWNCTWNEWIAPIPRQSVAANLSSILSSTRLDAGERRLRRLTGRDQRAGFDIHAVRSRNPLARQRRVELQSVIVEQILSRRAAAKMQRPNSARRRICQAGANAAIQRTARRNRQQDVGELIGARAGRQQGHDIADRLLDQKVGCRIEKRSGNNRLIRIRPRAARPIRSLRAKRDRRGGGDRRNICPGQPVHGWRFILERAKQTRKQEHDQRRGKQLQHHGIAVN